MRSILERETGRSKRPTNNRRSPAEGGPTPRQRAALADLHRRADCATTHRMPKYAVNDAAGHHARELIGARRYVLHPGTVILPVSGGNSLLVAISADGAWTMT
jgi:hypothetical protein